MDIRKVFADIEKELDRVVYDIWNETKKVKGGTHVIFDGECTDEVNEKTLIQVVKFDEYLSHEFELNSFYFHHSDTGLYVSVEILDKEVSNRFEKELVYEFIKNYNEKPTKEVK